jgi:type IV pilus assembly protein PilQ
MDLLITRDDISTDVAVEGQPGIDTNSVKTNVLVNDGETVVLGGILRTSDTWIKDRQPTPDEADIGMFTLFKSLDANVSRQQFIIFITPTILEYAAEANHDLKDYFNLYEVYPTVGEEKE